MRQKIFDAFAVASGRYPWIVVALALVLTVITGAVSENLKMETRFLDLVPSDDPAAIEFNDILRQYSSASQIMIGIEGKDRKQMIAFADELGRRAKEATYTDKETGEKKPYVKRITVRADTEFIAEHGLMLSKVSNLENLDELFQNLELAPLLTAYNDFLEREYIEDSGSVTEREKEDRAIDGLKNIVKWLEGIDLAGSGDKQSVEHSEYVADLLSTGNPYMFSDDDELLLAMVMPAVSIDRMEETIAGTFSLREDVINDIKYEKLSNGELKDRYPGLRVRMAGMPALALEEGEVAFSDMGMSSLISLILVFALFILAFRMWTAPLLAIVNLIFGIVWTSGFIALTIGRLNLFTMMFAVILIGLGIDFAIHLNAAFSTARSEGKDIQASLREMYRRAGAGVVTGALTTAAAFLALALTGLDALVELGVVLGAGIILTLLASLTLLPAMYVIHSRIGNRFSKGKERKAKSVRLAFPFLASLGHVIQKRPWPVLIVLVVITAGFGYAMRGARFEPDMLEIEPADMPSVLLHRDILKRFELHPDYGMVTSKSLEETRPMVKKLKKNRLIGRVDAITEFVPSEKQQKKRARIVSGIGERMKKILEPDVTVAVPGAPPVIVPPGFMTRGAVSDEQAKQLLAELDRLQMNVQEIGQLAFTSVKKRLQRTCDRLTGGEDKRFSVILGLKERLAKTPDLPRKMAAYEREYIPRLAGKLEKMAGTSKITLESLPESITERYMSSEGSNLVTVYSSVDLWQEGKTDLFLQATKKASDRVTGSAVLVERLIQLIGSKGLIATFLALGAVFIILLVDFRHLGYALLGMMPLLGGFTWMMGIFVLLGKKFDVANVEAIPLILGIGIDDAVHVLHAIRRQGAGALPNVLRHTGRALLLTSLTTGIAFGSIAFASHRGLAGMGLLLVLGVVCCFITSVVLLPALVRIFFKDGKSNPKDKEVQNA
ncbi:MAG: MMPL family transporter [Deltaproteobacteria bacterium]|nr:MMPL family transporter [Deltaproteobacteria bacterium]